ncbi:MAG: hypothetical protein ABSG96_27175 [Terracidiphilus sp.]
MSKASCATGAKCSPGTRPIASPSPGMWVPGTDPAKASEVEIRFTAEGPAITLVELEHSKLERHGEGYRQLRDIFDGSGAWSGILALYAKKVEGRAE